MNSLKVRIEEVNNGYLLTLAEAKDDKVLGRWAFATAEELLQYLATVLNTRRRNVQD